MTRTWESVAPIDPFSALPNRVSPVGPGVTLEAVPAWFKREREHAKEYFGTREFSSSEACLKATIHSEGLGTNCEASWELIRMANPALWLAHPSSLHVKLVITAEPEPSPGGSVIRASSLESIRPNEKYAEASLKWEHLVIADKLASAIQGLPHPGSVWTAVRFLWLALTDVVWETRYICLWVAVEALFGPEDRRKITENVSKRVAKFPNNDDQEAKIACQLVKDGYDCRSAAVHGGRLGNLTSAESSKTMLTAEGIVLTCLRKILLDPALIQEFCSASRDHYLDALTKGFQP